MWDFLLRDFEVEEEKEIWKSVSYLDVGKLLLSSGRKN